MDNERRSAWRYTHTVNIGIRLIECYGELSATDPETTLLFEADSRLPSWAMAGKVLGSIRALTPAGMAGPGETIVAALAVPRVNPSTVIKAPMAPKR